MGSRLNLFKNQIAYSDFKVNYSQKLSQKTNQITERKQDDQNTTGTRENIRW